jgi:hypothetical protein
VCLNCWSLKKSESRFFVVSLAIAFQLSRLLRKIKAFGKTVVGVLQFTENFAVAQKSGVLRSSGFISSAMSYFLVRSCGRATMTLVKRDDSNWIVCMGSLTLDIGENSMSLLEGENNANQVVRTSFSFVIVHAVMHKQHG